VGRHNIPPGLWPSSYPRGGRPTIVVSSALKPDGLRRCVLLLAISRYMQL